MTQRRYWTGNAAKSRIIRLILEEVGEGGRALIFDYGCGQAQGWAKVLDDWPGLELVYYDLNPGHLAAAGRHLAGRRARPLTSADPWAEPPLGADYVVSLSVLEHVLDRVHYFQTAARHLRPGGLFFLNYDDGHFRNRLDLNEPLRSRDQVKEFFFNLLSRAGLRFRYQRRPTRAEVDRLAREGGFTSEGEFYSNLPSLKGFHAELEGPGWGPADREEFARRWQELEEFLNARFRRDNEAPRLGDTANLWPHFLSRTVLLRKPTS